MPRLSLYRPEKTHDYKFLDRTIKEMFTVGATDLYVHKYLGVKDTGPSADFTQPQYDSLNPNNIQDLLFLENRDRKYDTSIYRLRGHYNVQNLDFDLSQFGLFLNNDIIFITIHYNEMIDVLGRKLMVGDVLELPHLIDYHPLNETIPTGLRRYYQITDGNFASEGFSQTWYPHLWRIKCEPLVDSQEFANILQQPTNKDNYLGDWDKDKNYVPGYLVSYGDKNWAPLQPVPAGIPCAGTYWTETAEYPAGSVITYNGITYQTKQLVPAGTPVTNTNYFEPYWQLDTADNLRDILSRYNKNIEVNDAVIAEAARIVPKNGYDRSQLYVVPTFDGKPAPPVNVVVPTGSPVATRGNILMVSSPGYMSSPVIRVAAAALDSLFKLTDADFAAMKKFMSVSLETARLAPETTDGGSGQVQGNLVLKAQALGDITGPYGTADNTFATADQWPPIYIDTSEFATLGQTVIKIQNLFPTSTPDTWYQNPGINVGPFVTTVDGAEIQVFNDNTRIINVDVANSLITLSSGTIAEVPIGSKIKVGSTFIGEPINQNTMDYRADCDPRFFFIARVSPQDFGYSSGYMFGDGTAPNGIPTGSGITFPSNPATGDYFLRTDYLPNLLFRYDGNLWVRIAQSNRSGVAFDSTIPSEQSQLASFINNEQTLTLTDGTVVPQQQPLSTLLKIVPD